MIQLLSGFKDVVKNFDKIPTQAPQMGFVFNKNQKAMVEQQEEYPQPMVEQQQQEQQDSPRVVLSLKDRFYRMVTSPQQIENTAMGGLFLYRRIKKISQAGIEAHDIIHRGNFIRNIPFE